MGTKSYGSPVLTAARPSASESRHAGILLRRILCGSSGAKLELTGKRCPTTFGDAEVIAVDPARSLSSPALFSTGAHSNFCFQ